MSEKFGVGDVMKHRMGSRYTVVSLDFGLGTYIVQSERYPMNFYNVSFDEGERLYSNVSNFYEEGKTYRRRKGEDNSRLIGATYEVLKVAEYTGVDGSTVSAAFILRTKKDGEQSTWVKQSNSSDFNEFEEVE